MGVLTTRRREELLDSAFAVPQRRAYPIDSHARARNALARVAQHGSNMEKHLVRTAVHDRYPGIEVSGLPQRRRNPGPFGLPDIGTVVIIGLALYVVSKLGGKGNKPPECYVSLGPFTWDICAWGNEQTGATPVGGTLPSGQPLNYGVSAVDWDSFLGIVRAGSVTFRVALVHDGPADTPTVAISLGAQQVGATQITVPSDNVSTPYQVRINAVVQPGMFPVSVLVIGSSGIVLNQAMLQTIAVYP